MKYTQLFFLATISMCIMACQSEQVLTFEEANSFFQKEKKHLEKVANFLEEQSGNTYDFASLDISDGTFRLTLGKQGKQENRRLENSPIEANLDELLGKRKCYSIFKEKNQVYFLLKGSKEHGVESASGLIKCIDGKELSIDFSWAKSPQTRNLTENWHYYVY